jgi:hypothetical protein
MIRLIRKGTDPWNFDYYANLINSTTSTFDQNWPSYDQLVLETCHMAKFICQLDDSIRLVRKFEKPDFIINCKDRIIGLEHQILVHGNSKSKEGSMNDLVKELQKEFKRLYPNKNLHLTIYLKPNLEFKKVDKPRILMKMIQIIDKFITYNQLPENDYIEDLFLQQHSILTFDCNLGAWWQKNLELQSLCDAIEKKEKKIDEYKINSGSNEQWLLIVIGSVGESSYTINSPESFNNFIETRFDKVYLLEDFRANLYEIK